MISPCTIAVRGVCPWLAAFAAAIGALTLVGWVGDIAWLKSIHPALTPMKINTAVCLLLAAAGIGCLSVEPSPAWRRRSGQALGVLVGLIGLLTVLEYALAWDLGIDQLLAREQASRPDVIYPGRMAPLTAFAFSLSGAALLLLGVDRPRWVTVAQSLALIVSLLVYFCLVGYALGVQALYRQANVIVAFNTVLGLGALSLAIIVARPASRLMAPLLSPDAGGVLARRLLPAILLIPLVIGMLRLHGEQAGLYGAPAGVALMVLATAVTLLALSWWTAWRINRMAAETAVLARFPDENPNPVVRVGRDRKLLYSNIGAQGLLREWGCEVGQPVSADVDRWVEAALAAGHPWETEVVAGNKTFSLLISPIAEHGYVNIFGRDITEGRQAEIILGKQAALIDLSPDAILVRTFEGTITFWSQGAADLYGWTKEEAVGVTTHALLQTQFPTAHKILIVEDNVDSATSLAELLEIWGQQVRAVHDGPAAIEAALAFRPDIVLLDIGLPGMNGYEVARRLRREPALEGVIMVALTGYGQEEDRRKAEEAGFDRHFTKPIDPEALQSLLEQAA